MPKVDLFNQNGEKVGDLQLEDSVFGIEVNTYTMHQVVKALLANKRQGTQSTKTRAEVSGGGIKPWRQKGTGRARQGSIRAPQWIHGGVVFAPKPRDYRMSVPKSMKKVAMKSALTSKVNENLMVVVDAIKLEAPKTKEIVKMLKAFDSKKTLIITNDADQNAYKSARNIEGVQIIPVNNINVYDILKYNKVVITKDAVSKIEEVYA